MNINTYIPNPDTDKGAVASIRKWLKEYPGKFNTRIPSDLHADIASAEGKSLNQWVVETLGYAIHT